MQKINQSIHQQGFRHKWAHQNKFPLEVILTWWGKCMCQQPMDVCFKERTLLLNKGAWNWLPSLPESSAETKGVGYQPKYRVGSNDYPVRLLSLRKGLYWASLEGRGRAASTCSNGPSPRVLAFIKKYHDTGWESVSEQDSRGKAKGCTLMP